MSECLDLTHVTSAQGTVCCIKDNLAECLPWRTGLEWKQGFVQETLLQVRSAELLPITTTPPVHKTQCADSTGTQSIPPPFHPYIPPPIHHSIHTTLHPYTLNLYTPPPIYPLHPYTLPPIHPPSIHSSIHAPLHPYNPPPIHLSIYTSLHPYALPSIHPSIHTPLHPNTIHTPLHP